MFFITNLKININRLPTFLATLVLVVEVQQFIGRNTTVCNAFSFCFYHPDYHVWHAVLRLKNQQTQLVNKKNPLKGNGNTFFIFSFERTFKLIYNTLLPFFHILLTSTNVLIERNEMSAIFNFCRYACHVTTGVTQYFYLDNH